MFPTANPSDVAVVQEVCNAVSNRAAKLAAAGKSSLYLAWLSLHNLMCNTSYYYFGLAEPMSMSGSC